MEIISSPALITASNVSLFVVFSISIIIIYNLIFKNIKLKNDLLKIIKQSLNDSELRTPFGFLIMLIGLLMYFGAKVPKYIIPYNTELWNLLYTPTFGYYVYTHILIETFIYFGFAIIFWPSFMIMSYHIFGVKTKNFHKFVSLGIIFSFKLFLTILGIVLHYHLT